MWRFVRQDAGEVMEVVSKFVYFEVIILTCIAILTEAVWRYSVKKVFRKTKSLLD